MGYQKIRAGRAGIVMVAVLMTGLNADAAPVARGKALVQPAARPGLTRRAAPLTALGTLESGEWELKSRDGEDDVRRLCLGDPRQLLQIRQSGSNCSRFVVTDSASHLVVTYDCAAAGNGRTDLRVETPRLVQIQSQGVADSAPFSLTWEGRRVGSCK